MTLPIERFKEAYSNWRYNPFTAADMAVDASEDGLFIPSGSPFIIQLLELAQYNDPTTVSVRCYGVKTDVDQDSGSGQLILYVADTAGFSPADKIIIDRGGAREEERIIDTVQAGISLTVTVNLTYTHTAVQEDDVEKYIAFAETAGAPAQSQFRVDYPPADGEGTGLVEFNQNDADKEVRINYKATGSPILEEYLDTKLSYPAGAPADNQIVGFASGVPYWLQLPHANLAGVSADQHHAQIHTHASHTSIGANDHHPQIHTHASHTSIGANDHHPQAHTLASHSSKAHSELTGVSSDQHHSQVHTHASHTGIGANDHHPQIHTHASHTGIGVNDHHAQLHAATHHSGGNDKVNHDSLLGFVANEHIDWTNTSEILKTTGRAHLLAYMHFDSVYSTTDNIYGYNCQKHVSDSSKLKCVSGTGTVHPQAILAGPGTGIRFLTMASNPGADADILIATYERMRIKPDGNIQAYGGFGVGGKFDLGTPTELTISGGAITVTRSYHKVDTESEEATDNLDTINGGVVGMKLILRSVHGARVTTLRNGVGNVFLNLAGNFALDDPEDKIELLCDDYPVAGWYEINRSDNH